MNRTILMACALALGLLKTYAVATEELVDYPVSQNVRGHENVEWSTSYAFHLTDGKKSLPRVLLVGDSICQSYQHGVAASLEGKMTVSYWASSYCVTSPCYMKFLSIYLDEAEYSVVHFNSGCHSLSTPNENWEKGLRRALALIRLKQPKAKIVWATTTPNRNLTYNNKIKELNKIGSKVVVGMGGVAIDDLFSLMSPLDRTENWGDDFHFKPNAVNLMAQQVSGACLKAEGLNVTGLATWTENVDK